MEMLHKNWPDANVRTRTPVLQVAQTTHFAMGTIMAHKVFGQHADESLVAVCSEITRLEWLLSRFIPTSDISRLNESAGIQMEKVSLDTFEVLQKAVDFSRSCPGCFDITIEPLVNLWRDARNTATQPDKCSIQTTLDALVNFRDLSLDAFDLTAGLRYAGQGIDLGGIGKGFAGDRIREVFLQFGITSAYSNLGGNLVTIGARPDGSPWQIGIQHPRQENQILGAVAVENQSVVTSGDYQRYYTDRQGKRHHHILNPTTGYPAESGLVSVSIITENSMAADALSTAVFVAGMEKGLDFLATYPETEAILVDDNLHVYLTRGLQNRFQAAQVTDVTILD
jgi:thiamine biosynthesis lipoprotein